MDKTNKRLLAVNTATLDKNRSGRHPIVTSMAHLGDLPDGALRQIQPVGSRETE